MKRKLELSNSTPDLHLLECCWLSKSMHSNCLSAKGRVHWGRLKHTSVSVSESIPVSSGAVSSTFLAKGCIAPYFMTVHIKRHWECLSPWPARDQTSGGPDAVTDSSSRPCSQPSSYCSMCSSSAHLENWHSAGSRLASDPRTQLQSSSSSWTWRPWGEPWPDSEAVTVVAAAAASQPEP